MVEKIISRSVRLMFASGLVLGAQMVGAQEVEKAPQKVEITGSRIPTIAVDGTSPVTQLSAKDIKIDGVRNVEDMLNNLPQVFADQGGALSNGATGTATVSLRGLGADRTLVLVNGKRLPMGNTSSSAADLNQIPTGLIKRVDILTGGAGAVYGAGAVAGVVNFILKDNFEGAEFQYNISGNNHKQQNDYVSSVVKGRGFEVPENINYDGKIRDASLLIGGNFGDGRGNATLYFAYKKTEAVLQSERDFTACALGSTKTALTCAGSGTNAAGRIGLQTGNSYFIGDAAGVTRPYTSADAYNYGPLNYLQRPSESYGFNAQGHFDINDKMRVYEEFNFHTNHTAAQIAGSGAFGVETTLNYDNPMLTSAWRNSLGLKESGDTADVFVYKRNVEGGGRVADITDTSFRSVLGLKGEVSNWNYDVFAQIGRVNHSGVQLNYFDNDRISRALDVVTGPAGTPVCRSVVDGSDANCVPYNVYKAGAINKAQTDYLSITALSAGYTQQTVVGANVSSDLGNYGIKSPMSKQGIGVSFGVERRNEVYSYTADAATASGSLAGSGGPSPSLEGSFSVKEIFGEVKVPLMEKRPFAEVLEMNTSYRRSDYSTGRKTDTWGVGLDWSPVKLLRLRGSVQQAVRAPTIFDLYTLSGVGLGGPSNDPCAGDSAATDPSDRPSATAAECARTGVTAAQYGKMPKNPANQYQASYGGNINVNPEKAKTNTIGFVIEPMRNLTMSLDAFDIKIEDTISSVDPTTALDQCLKTGNPLFCGMMHRDKFGSLWLTDDGYIKGGTTNIGAVRTSGFDIGAAYFMKLDTMGKLNFTLNGTALKKVEVENVPGLGSYNCAGYFGPSCGTPTPKWRHKLRTTWSTPWSFDVSATWRHLASTESSKLNSSPLLSGTVNDRDAHIGQFNYLDLYAQYNLTKNLVLSGGITNLLDKDPPTLSGNATGAGGSANGNTYPQVFEALGRKIHLNLTAKF